MVARSAVQPEMPATRMQRSLPCASWFSAASTDAPNGLNRPAVSSTISRLPTGFTERDLGAVKPHVVRAAVGHSHPKRQADLRRVQPHGDFPGAGGAAVGGDEPNDPAVVAHPGR